MTPDPANGPPRSVTRSSPAPGRSPADRVRVLIVDDHRMFAEALRLLLAGEADIEVVGAAESAGAALAACRNGSPDVVLLDLDLPDMDGLEVARRIGEDLPGTRVIAVTALSPGDVLADALEAGVSGFVPKTRTADEIPAAIRRVATGERVVLVPDAWEILDESGEGAREPEASRLAAQLTEREVQILQAFASGLPTREVARRLSISVLTVQTHVRNVLSKLGVHSKLEAVSAAARAGLVRVGDRRVRRGLTKPAVRQNT